MIRSTQIQIAKTNNLTYGVAFSDLSDFDLSVFPDLSLDDTPPVFDLICASIRRPLHV